MAALGSGFEFFHFSPEEPCPERMGEFVAEHVNPHRLWQQKKNTNPTSRAGQHWNPRLIGAARRPKDKPQRLDRAKTNWQQNNCDDEFGPFGHGERIQKLEFRSQKKRSQELEFRNQKKIFASLRLCVNICVMTTDEALQIFRDTGALLEGHFVLRSGLHSRQFFQCALALQQMPIVEKLGAALADKLRPLGATTVIAPAMGGLVIGQEVARQLKTRFVFVEKEEGKLVLRRGFKISPGEKILIVEDVVTKGGRVQETIDIVRANQGNLAGIAMIVDRSNGSVNFGVPTFSLIALNVETFAPDKLPADLAKVPATKPGSK